MTIDRIVRVSWDVDALDYNGGLRFVAHIWPTELFEAIAKTTQQYGDTGFAVFHFGPQIAAGEWLAECSCTSISAVDEIWHTSKYASGDEQQSTIEIVLDRWHVPAKA